MMNWNSKSLLETLVQNEENTAALYRDIASYSIEGIGPDFFESLAKDEDRHQQMYQNMQSSLSDIELIKVDEDQLTYLESLMDKNVLREKERLLEAAKQIKSKEQVYDIAEKIERDTVMFVSEIIELFPEVARKELREILKEEKKHLNLILNKRADHMPSYLML